MENDKPVLAGFLAVLSIGVLMGMAFALFRVIVPLILEAHFFGSVFAASVVGFAGALAIGLVACALFSRIARLVK